MKPQLEIRMSVHIHTLGALIKTLGVFAICQLESIVQETDTSMCVRLCMFVLHIKIKYKLYLMKKYVVLKR